MPAPDPLAAIWRRPLVAVVGPTASGKTALAVDLALSLPDGGEVVNADSMALYRGMDVGTAKPSAGERRGVPHHLLDIWEVTKQASVAEYQALACAAIANIRSRDRWPILVGGSGLYVRAVVDRIDFPGTDPSTRRRFENELVDAGAAKLHARLTALDPAAARTILPTNGRRIVRALEVMELTGRPFSATLPNFSARPDVLQVGLDRDDLDQRIEARVAVMFDSGLVAEVRRLVQAGLRAGPTAARALGYAEVLAMIDGSLGPAEARARTAQSTRRFVRRQRSWFRRDPRVAWLDAAEPQLAGRVLRMLAG